MDKISLMIIGAQKAATTSLKNYLTQHPQIRSHKQIEFSFFVNDSEYEKGYDYASKIYFKNLEKSFKGKIIAKNASICSSEKALMRLKENVPDCKIIFILRNPIDRAYSAYKMAVYDGWINRDFNELRSIIERNETNDILFRKFLALGHYHEQLTIIYKYFDKDAVRIFFYENLVDNISDICIEVFNYLDVDTKFTPDIGFVHNRTMKAKSRLVTKVLCQLRAKGNFLNIISRKVIPASLFTKFGLRVLNLNKSNVQYGPMNVETREILKKYFEPYNKELSEMINVDINWN